MEFKTIITTVGKAKFANAAALGQKIDFKYMALGDGSGEYPKITEEQVGLVNEVYRGEIRNVEIDKNNPNWIKSSITIPANIGGFFIRELGIFDFEGDLIGVGIYPETYKPKFEEGSSKDIIINMIIEVTNTSIVTIKADPSVILASKKDIYDLDERIQVNSEQLIKNNRELEDCKSEIQTITLTNNQEYPFNNSIKTVNLLETRNSLNYSIIIEVMNGIGGFIGDIVITEKALNGFKIAYTGSATSIEVKLYIQGGINS